MLSKVFRVPHDNALLWQQSLLEAEIEQLVGGRVRPALTRSAHPHGAQHEDAVPRRPIQPDDVCPICCDAISLDRPVVYCRYGCGNNIHATCFKAYATHNSTNPAPLTCPLWPLQLGYPRRFDVLTQRPRAANVGSQLKGNGTSALTVPPTISVSCVSRGHWCTHSIRSMLRSLQGTLSSQPQEFPRPSRHGSPPHQQNCPQDPFIR